MRRLHVIESADHHMGGEIYYRHHEKFAHDPELREAYECGYKHGRKEAYTEIMEEQYGHGDYHERHYGRTMPPMMREHDHDWRQPEDDEIVYRRHRSRMTGRYI